MALLVLSTNTFAADVVILECGEFNFGPGINIRAVNTSLKVIPSYLTEGASCSVAIANLLSKGFKIQFSDISTAQFSQADNVIHNFHLVQ